jgi:putative ABC transport system ATP-binding protein
MHPKAVGRRLIEIMWWRKPKVEANDQAPADPDAPLIRLEHTSKVFEGDADEETRALDDVSVDIRAGEFITVTGPSGCGKSTFLSILALLDTPTSGQYLFGGRPTSQLTPAQKARMRNVEIGMVFQSFNLIGDMTITENIEYPLVIRGVPPHERSTRVAAALDRVGLGARGKQRPGSLSGGHQQLVAVARAIAGRPAILLADEPTGNLDSKSGENLMQMFSELHKGGSTLCIATHDPRWYRESQRTIHLFDGKVVAAPPAET